MPSKEQCADLALSLLAKAGVATNPSTADVLRDLAAHYDAEVNRLIFQQRITPLSHNPEAHPPTPEISPEPFTVDVVDEAVVVRSADAVATAITAEAAEVSARRLVEAARAVRERSQ